MTAVPGISSFIGGEELRGVSAFDFVRPQDGKLIGRIAEAGEPGVEAAVRAASAAFAAHRKAPLHQRIAWLKSAAAALTGAADDIAALICATGA